MDAKRKAFKEGMREAEEDDRSQQQTIASAPKAPQISQMSDEQITAEMNRRAESKNV